MFRMSFHRETDEDMWITEEEFEVKRGKPFINKEIFSVQVEIQHQLRARSSDAQYTNNRMEIKYPDPRLRQNVDVRNNDPFRKK